MPDPIVILIAIATVVVGSVAGCIVVMRTSMRPAQFADSREERLTHRVAEILGCPPAEVLPVVRREASFASSLSDETLIKRAVYHYRREMPEQVCTTYRDTSRG